MTGQLTWYDVLDILPTSSVAEARRAFAAKASVLRPELTAGAPPAVVAAAGKARAAIEAALQCLSDPVARERYDTQIGLLQPGGGLDRPAGFPSDEGPAPFSWLWGNWAAAVDLLGGLADLLAPHPARPHRARVPDVRGLFVNSGRNYLARHNLGLEVIRLTPDPMPVEGLIVDQRPLPGEMADRSGELTAHVWHPPRQGTQP